MVNHPSGLESEGEIAYVSADFWMLPENLELKDGITNQVWDRLLSFQQGWKACKDFYNISE